MSKKYQQCKELGHTWDAAWIHQELTGILEEQTEPLIARYGPWFSLDSTMTENGWVRLSGSRRAWYTKFNALEFDADSDKVVDEVTRAIVASLFQQNKSFPVYKLRMDLMAAFYLVNKAGDVVLMNKDFLQKCPKPLECLYSEAYLDNL